MIMSEWLEYVKDYATMVRVCKRMVRVCKRLCNIISHINTHYVMHHHHIKQEMKLNLK